MGTTNGGTKMTEYTYEKACEILGFTSLKSLAENAKLAQSFLNRAAYGTPLRYLVAAEILIEAGNQY